MNHKAVYRTAPATQGLLKIGIRETLNHSTCADSSIDTQRERNRQKEEEEFFFYCHMSGVQLCTLILKIQTVNKQIDLKLVTESIIMTTNIFFIDYL